MRLAEPDDLKVRISSGQLLERLRRKVIYVVGHDVSVFHPQQPHRKRVQVGHEDEAMTARLEQRRGLAQEFSRLNHVLDDRPKRDGIEMPAAKIRIEERLTNDLDAAPLRVVERGAGDIRSGDRK